MNKIKNILLIASSIISVILILIIIILGFVISSKEKEFSYNKIKSMANAERRITDRYDKIKTLPLEDQLKEIRKEKLPLISSGFFKKDYPIIIYRIDYDKADLLYLYEYIEKEHQQIINFSSFIIDK